MTTNNNSRINRRFAWAGRMAAGTCLAVLMAVASTGQEPNATRTDKPAHSIASAPKKSYDPASVRALPGLQCRLYPEGSKPSAGLAVFTDDDGYARFYAVRMTATDKVRRLTLDCQDADGRPSVFSVDLTSDEMFQSRPLNLATERGTDRPALAGDPLSYTQAELIQANYGLRPDPDKDPAAFSRWLKAAQRPGRMLEAKRPSSHSHTVTTEQAPYWVGSVLGGAPKYIAVEGTFNVPQGIGGGDETSEGTEIAIWNGLGGFNTGSGLIQAGVYLETNGLTAQLGTFREYCCGDGDSNGYGGAFVPKAGDQILDQNWYCDAYGNPNLNGGYGCSFLQDLTDGAILSCTSAAGSPCWSVKAIPGMTLGENAEFIIENQSLACCGPAVQFTDFTPTVTFAGSAYSTTTDSYSQTISSDSQVYLLTDFTNSTSHMNVSLGKTDQTYFRISQFEPAPGPTALQGTVHPCGNKAGLPCYGESIAVGPDADGSGQGDAWMLSAKADPSGNNHYIYRWENGQWVLQTGTGVMIAVSPTGNPWLVNNRGNIYYYNGSAWEEAPTGCATSIGVGPNGYGWTNGDPWIIGCDGGVGVDGSIYQLQYDQWVKQPGHATQIAVGDRVPWVITASGGIYYWGGSSFVNVPGCATSIGVGPSTAGALFGDTWGDAWVTGCTAEATGYGVYQLQKGSFVPMEGYATQIAVSPDLGVPWAVNDLGQVYR